MAKPRSHPREATHWIAAAILALTAAVGGLVIVLQPVNAASGPPSSSSAELPLAAPGARPDEPSRITAFHARLAAFAPMEARVWRAFFPPAPIAPPLHRRAQPGRRVAQGATPQACLAQAVYYEARGEPAEGQAAVAQVVLNRTRSRGRPPSVCGVVFEGASHSGCQFSFACDGRLGGHRLDAAAWRRAETVADAALAGHEAPELRTAVNYHADYVRPGWAGRLERTAEIGRHIFYAATAPAAHAWSAWTRPPADTPPPRWSDGG